ncbi:MlaD family protein [Breoghania sp.]|uniref:MlaD family protein n=1 Tax=Breoghania sp. TaxID=2065378 RepID=UPI002AA956C0|nr:MlaD family protein [Breoghania sp.]
METRANYIAIGSVVLASIVAAFIFAWWLATTGDGNSRRTLRVVFPGAVTGLEVGGTVFFNGIRVGDVTRLTFAQDDPTKVVAITAINPNTPLRADTKASLGFSGLTGVAYVELVGGSRDKPALFSAEEDPELLADRSGFQDLMAGASDVLAKADKSLTSINDLIAANRPTIDKSVENVGHFTDALASNADGVNDFMASISEATKAFSSLSGKMEGLVTHAEALVGAVDPDQVSRFVDNMAKASDKLDSALSQVDQVTSGARQVTDELAAFTKGLNEELAKVSDVISAVDRDKVAAIVSNVEEVTNRVTAKLDTMDKLISDAQGAAASIRKTSDVVAGKSEKIALFMDTASDVTVQLGAVSDEVKRVVNDAGKVITAVEPTRVSDILASVDKVTKSIAGQSENIEGTIADARGASADLKAFTSDIRERQPDIDKVISDAKSVSGKLDEASSKVNDILVKVDGYVEGDGEGLIKEATAAAKSIRIVADTLADRVGPITAGLDRFSNRGLRNMETLIEQARVTLVEIRRVFSNFDQNPSRVLYGGEGVPVYDGDRKRR